MTTLTLVSVSVLQLLVGISLQSQDSIVYPSEYAYHKDSVTRAEPTSANCRNYPSLAENIRTENYIQCNGTQLRLTDSDLGPEQYRSSYYYVWSVETSRTRQLLFIFPTRVDLTTITLHYYSDSQRGLPRLRFYAAPDDFDVWDAPPGNSRYANIAAVPPGEESVGRRNISKNLNFSTTKILMVKFGSNFTLAVSEVEFFTCNVQTQINSNSSTNAMPTTATFTKASSLAGNYTTEAVDSSDLTSTSITPIAMESASTDLTLTSTVLSFDYSESAQGGLGLEVVIGIVTIVLALVLAVVVAIIIGLTLKRLVKKKLDHDSSYSVLSRGTNQQIQPQSPNDLYDQIKLSPLTGQAEFVSNIETDNISRNFQHQQDTHQHIETQQHGMASMPNATAMNSLPQNHSNTSASEQPTYAVVNKVQKKKKQTEKESMQESKAKDRNEEESVTQGLDGQKTGDDTATDGVESLDQLYTVVKKKPKGRGAKEDENVPPIPPHTVEELYTAVNKISKVRAATKEEEAPPIPPHTVEELYTAVNKTLKGNAADDEEEAPPIPHTDGH